MRKFFGGLIAAFGLMVALAAAPTAASAQELVWPENGIYFSEEKVGEPTDGIQKWHVVFGLKPGTCTKAAFGKITTVREDLTVRTGNGIVYSYVGASEPEVMNLGDMWTHEKGIEIDDICLPPEATEPVVLDVDQDRPLA